MIEMMIVAMIVAKVGMDSAGKLATDVGFAVRGKVSPRLTEARKRRPRGAASRYFGELWDDAWTGASAKRAARRAGRTSSSRPRGAATSFWAGWLQDQRRAAGRSWDRGWTRLDEKRREKASRPRPGQVTVPGTVVPNAQDEDRPRPQDETRDGPQDEPAPVPDEDHKATQDEDEQDEDRYGMADLDETGIRVCRRCRFQLTSVGPVCENCLKSGPDSGPDNDPSTPATPTTEGPTTMSITTGEVVGLDQTLRFCEDSAQAYSEMVHQIEQAQAALNEGDVTGPAAAAFAAAMDQSQAAAISMTAAAEELRKHRVVAEAIDAVQGAGTREFYTTGR